MNIYSAINQGAKLLKDKYILNPYLDSEILMTMAINKDRQFLLLNSNHSIEEEKLKCFQNLIYIGTSIV